MSALHGNPARAITQLMAQATHRHAAPVPLGTGLRLPDDLAAFYRQFGSATLYPGSAYSFSIRAAANLQRADDYVLGEDIGEAISAHWYVIATCGEQTIAICLAEGPTFGACYDAFWDCYPSADASTRIAGSFTDLLTRLVHNAGRSLFWIPGHH